MDPLDKRHRLCQPHPLDALLQLDVVRPRRFQTAHSVPGSFRHIHHVEWDGNMAATWRLEHGEEDHRRLLPFAARRHVPTVSPCHYLNATKLLLRYYLNADKLLSQVGSGLMKSGKIKTYLFLFTSGDVHVIDLDSINEKEEEEVEVEAPPPEVHVHLAVGDPAVSQFRRNVTLVLQSIHPVTWILSSAQQLKGHLVILVSIHIPHSEFQQFPSASLCQLDKSGATSKLIWKRSLSRASIQSRMAASAGSRRWMCRYERFRTSLPNWFSRWRPNWGPPSPTSGPKRLITCNSSSLTGSKTSKVSLLPTHYLATTYSLLSYYLPTT